MMPVNSLRDISDSIYKRVANLLAAPPSGTGVTAYTVYGEVELRRVQAKTLTPARPSVFIVDAMIRPVEIALPMVAIEVVVTALPFEIGNDAGLSFETDVHCFGRQKNEASLLAYFLQKNFRPLTIYNYGDPNSLMVRETALVDPRMQIRRASMLNDTERQMGAYDNWYVVSLSGQIKDV